MSFYPPMIYPNRGYALLLQENERESQRDFAKCSGTNNGQQRMLFEFHLRKIEGQIKERLRRRAQR